MSLFLTNIPHEGFDMYMCVYIYIYKREARSRSLVKGEDEHSSDVSACACHM